MHLWIAVSRAALGWVAGGGAGGNDVPVQTIVSGTVLGNSRCSRLTGGLHTIEEFPPLRNSSGEGIISVVLNATTLPHVAVAFLHTMLAGIGPGAISIFDLIGISIGEGSEFSDICSA